MVMNFYGKNLSKDEIVKSISMKAWGTPIAEMESYTRRQKFESYTFYGWNEKKMKYLIAQRYPLIVLGEIPSNWYQGGSYAGTGHYVVIVGYDDNEKKFTINDPGPGQKRKISYEIMKNFLSSTKFSESNYVLCIYPKGE
jgi:ABC-type bacteriocin/lantibiotic exporter with double-glycine peptidase domain